MLGYWISLPEAWILEDVQAALNVVVTFLSAVAIFVFIRCCWVIAARRIARGEQVPLHALVSLNTLGEVFDIFLLLKDRLLSIRYVKLLLQSIVVVFLSAAALLSGPITRYSSQYGLVIREKEVPGLLATRHHSSILWANVVQNVTATRLDRADYPTDQLLDFLPSNTVDWVYDPTQWNSSWSFDCKNTEKTPVKLATTANCAFTVIDQLPALEDTVFSFTKYDNYSTSWGGYYDNSTTFKDILLFVYGVKEWDYDDDDDTSHSMSIMLSAIHLHNVVRPKNTSLCDFGVGPVQDASFTKIECELRRKAEVEDYYMLAYPDVYVISAYPKSYTNYYQARFTQQSTSDSAITAITPRELARFYQAYTITKDLQSRQPVVRKLSVQVQVVQISIIFLAVAVLTLVLIILGLLVYGSFTILNWRAMTSTPQSKLDWAVNDLDRNRTIVNETQKYPPPVGGTKQFPNNPHSLSRSIDHTTKLGLFEAAVYGNGRKVVQSLGSEVSSSLIDDAANLTSYHTHDEHELKNDAITPQYHHDPAQIMYQQTRRIDTEPREAYHTISRKPVASYTYTAYRPVVEGQ